MATTVIPETRHREPMGRHPERHPMGAREELALEPEVEVRAAMALPVVWMEQVQEAWGVGAEIVGISADWVGAVARAVREIRMCSTETMVGTGVEVAT
ncbi:MAG: hypothetical protein ACI9X4_002696, partial [Glaciecola sp.]